MAKKTTAVKTKDTKEAPKKSGVKPVDPKATKSKTDIKTKPVAKVKKEEVDLSYLPIWAKKTKKKVEELEKQLHQIAASIKKKHPNENENWVYGKARMRLHATLKSDAQSTARPFYCRKMFKSPPFDFGNQKYEKHLAAYKNNPREAKDNNLVRIKVETSGKKVPIPIENMEYFGNGNKNPSFGKDLPLHNWIQSIGLVAIPVREFEKGKGDQMKRGVLTLNGRYADPTDEAYLGDAFDDECWFKANFNVAKKMVDQDGQKVFIENETEWELKPASNTNPEPTNIEDLSIDDIINLYNDIYVPLQELNDYHEAMVADQHEFATKQDKTLDKTANNTMMITQGQVIDIQLSDGSNSTKILIDTEDVGFGGDDDDIMPQSTAIWFDKDLSIDFGKFSEIMVFGGTSRTRKKDFITNEMLDEWNQTSITGKGYKIIELAEPDTDDVEYEDEDSEAEGEAELDEEELETDEEAEEESDKETEEAEESVDDSDESDDEEEAEEEWEDV